MKMRNFSRLAPAAAALLLAGQVWAANSTNADAIPDRPEKLRFPALAYEPPDPAQHRLILKSGPVAYVVPDRELPLINIVVYVRTGQYVEPDGKAGLSDMTGYLLARGGTATRTAEELEEKLAFLAAQLSSGVGETQGSVSLNLLSKDLDEGLALLREVLTAPRFQEDKIELYRAQMLQGMKQRNDETSDIEGRERAFLGFGEKFWANRYPTKASVEGLTRADLQAFHRRWFVPANFVLAVNGDFDRDAMVKKIETLFAQWPFPGETPPAIPADKVFARPGIYVVNKDVNQGRVGIMLPGIQREDPDFFPAALMNDILGGGGFTSRIMNRVRSDEGLAYSASSSFPGGVYYPMNFVAGFQTKSATVPYAISIVLEELARMTNDLVKDEELKTSQNGFIDRLPRVFATKSQVANTFAQDEFTGRHARTPDYWRTYRSRIAGVTREQIQKVAQRFLRSDQAAILVVGKKEEILQGHPGHPVTLESVAPGQRVVDQPLRDPMTMEPLKP